MNLLKEKALYVIATLIIAAICTASTAVIKVAVLEEKVKSDHDLIVETHQDVKIILGKMK